MAEPPKPMPGRAPEHTPDRKASPPTAAETASGAWFLVALVMVFFLLFFGTTVVVYAVMSGWISWPF